MWAGHFCRVLLPWPESALVREQAVRQAVRAPPFTAALPLVCKEEAPVSVLQSGRQAALCLAQAHPFVRDGLSPWSLLTKVTGRPPHHLKIGP